MTSAQSVSLAVGWAVVATIGGGFACGLAIDRYGELGSLSLWPLGALTGYVAQKILRDRNRLIGCVLIASCVLAFMIAEVCWIHWNTEQGVESWLTALKLLPTFFLEYEKSALIAAIFTALGAWSAYRQSVTATPPGQYLQR